MAKIRIVTDSTAYITKDYAATHDIKIVPLSVSFSGISEDEGYPGEFASYFEKLKNSQDFPTTSQPSIDAFAKVYEAAISEGFEVLTIVLSAKLSGTFSSASVAAEMVGLDKISVIDSETSAGNLKLLVNMALEGARNGLTRKEIVEFLETQKKKTGISLTVDTLDYLKKGGRLSSTQALIGSMLKVRPVIALVDGKLEPVGKVRGKNKALELMMEQIPDTVEKISICHIFALEEALLLKAQLETKFSKAEVVIDELGPVIGSHLGPKAIGICSKWA
ncbi:MAG: DegV family protein [Vallitaleaceae bacterium]|nr:DegV family protein [Vallitaleaceae bacterium]